MLNKIITDYLWRLQFVGLGIVITIDNRRAKFYGKQQGWHFDICRRKDTIL